MTAVSAYAPEVCNLVSVLDPNKKLLDLLHLLHSRQLDAGCWVLGAK